MKIDSLTKRWIRNASDERAAANGYRFDESRGEHVCEFITNNLRLYEGEYAGKLVHLMDWQEDVFMRLFSWVKLSEHWSRIAGKPREIRRFRKAGIWVPKKNGKSPSAAMIGLYLLIADGEMGQKVFSAAKDGKQAGIMHMHAIKMCQQSDALAAVCKINKSTGRIVHEPTDSFYDILAGDNIVGQEGINGSVIIDETHVVDKRLADVIEFAGASRSEPLQPEFSTVGDNRQGYGHNQWDYGLSVERGEIFDDSFFFAAWAAPQDATDEQCADPKVWEKANPSWGYTIIPAEFKASFERAQKSITDTAKFNKYRLNIWQEAANPWLRVSNWRKCKNDRTFESFHGQDCWGALDLSKTRDMSAFVLIFKDETEEDTFYQFPWLWLPENVGRKNNHLASYEQWHADGFLEYCAEDTIDQRDIRKKIQELFDLVTIEHIGYDPRYAEELTKLLDEEDGIERVQILQTTTNLVGPIGEYERLVIAGRLHHNDHPVLNWQAGHVQFNPRNGLLMKPEFQDHRKIDAIDAGVMALKLALGADTAGSVYEERGLAVSGR